ncbi:MAG: hypothetical protein R2752_18635 [Vicinamibacterales bacterium]
MRAAALSALVAWLALGPSPPPPAGRSMVLLVDATESHHSGTPTMWGWQSFPGGPTRPRPDSTVPLWGPIREFRDALQPGDRATIGAVTDRLILEPGFADTGAQFEASAWRLLAKADAAVRWTTTPLWDAVDASITALESAPPPRLVVLVTDGRATGNRLGLDEVARHAVSAGVSVHIVLGLDQDGDPAIRPSSEARRLAESTGGLFESYAFVRTSPGREIEGPAARVRQVMEALTGGDGVARGHP